MSLPRRAGYTRGPDEALKEGEQRIPTPETNGHRVNERIRARDVLLIDADGKKLGVKTLPEALAVARQMDLDLVEVAPDANPPVVRIMDYNRFKYETAQRARESRKKATNTSVKEMKYRPKIGSGDFATKTRQVTRFLEEGHKVKITITFRGRELSHPELGTKILDELVEQLVGVAKVEAAAKLDGKNMTMVLAPDRRARQAQPQKKPGAAEVSQAELSTSSPRLDGATAGSVEPPSSSQTDGATPSSATRSSSGQDGAGQNGAAARAPVAAST